VRPYVRELQLSAYYNVPTAANVAELLRVANDMRQYGEMMSPRLRNEAFETAGRRAEALSRYQALQQKLRTSSLSSELGRAVDEAVKRLSAAKSS